MSINKTMKMYQDIFDDFKKHRSMMIDKVDRWLPGFDEYTIEVRYVDGSRDIYDSLLKTTRYIAPNEDPKNEVYDQIKWQREFSIRLHRSICKKAISQWELAGLCDISETILSKYVNGITIPNSYITYRLAKALDCDLNYLMGVIN